MTRYLLDTDALIDFSKGSEPATSHILSWIDAGDTLGVCAICMTTGISAFDSGDATFKRTLLEASRERAALVTTEKFEARAPHRISPLAGVQTYIVEDNLEATRLGQLRDVGVAVIVAED